MANAVAFEFELWSMGFTWHHYEYSLVVSIYYVIIKKKCQLEAYFGQS